MELRINRCVAASRATTPAGNPARGEDGSAVRGNTGFVGFVGRMHGVHVVEYVPTRLVTRLGMRIVAANSVGRSYSCNHCNRKTRPLHLARSLSTCFVPDQRNALVHAALGSE